MSDDPNEVQTDAYDRVSVGKYSDGSDVQLNKRTKAMLTVAEEQLGYPLTISQGSYHTGTKQSAGTHDRGGVVDLLAFQADRKVRVLREIGFAAWHRLPSEGDWPEHVHAVALGDKEMSDEARKQVSDYRNRRNGLASHAKDPTPRPKDPLPVFNYVAFLNKTATVKKARKRPTKKVAKTRTPNRDAIEKAAVKGLAEADSPAWTRFFAEILEHVRQGPDKPLRKKSAEISAKPHDKGAVKAVKIAAAPAKKSTTKKSTTKKSTSS